MFFDMFSIAIILAMQFIAGGLAAPLDSVSTPPEEFNLTKRHIADPLQRLYPGLWFEELWAPGDCTEGKRNKIISAVEGAVKMMEKLDIHDGHMHSAAWDRYFAPYAWWIQTGRENIMINLNGGYPQAELPGGSLLRSHIANTYQANILQVQRYPKHGNTNNEKKNSSDVEVQYRRGAESLSANWNVRTPVPTFHYTYF